MNKRERNDFMSKRKSFKQWCIDNSRQDILERWDYEKNNKTPDDITYGTKKKYWFKCDKHIEHKSELKRINDFTNGQEGSIKCKQCNSFAQWCIDNNKQHILNLWDYNLNKISPWDVTYSSSISVYFKCPNNKHKSEIKKFNDFTIKNANTLYCKQCNSFGQWGIDNLSEDFINKYWDYEKNIVSPWEIDSCSHKRVYLKCQEKVYHGNYDVICSNFTSRTSRCPYCNRNSGKVHPADSLGQYIIDNYGEEFFKKILSDKNAKLAFNYVPSTDKKIWWKCADGKHKKYYRSIKSSNISEFRCPECTRERKESILQEKVRLYLIKLGYGVLHEHKCNIIAQNPKIKNKRGQMPYDNEIVELKLICEVHGLQHYENCTGFFKNSFDLHKRKLYDRYKRIFAKIQGYAYLEIPYWTDNKQKEYRILIDNKIKEIFNNKIEINYLSEAI